MASGICGWQDRCCERNGKQENVNKSGVEYGNKFSRRMKLLNVAVYILATYTCSLEAGTSVDVNKCLFGNGSKNNENEKLMRAISPLVGRNLVTERGGYSYTVSVCSDVSKDHEFGSVTRTKNQEVVVLGRRNDTRVTHGENWLVLNYGSGDTIVDDDHIRRRTTVYLVCSQNRGPKKEQIQLVEEDGLVYNFILPTDIMCNFDEEQSGLKVFLIIVAVAFSAYCLIGITYKRYVHNAQKCQQLPHINFWSRVGNTLADGCNYVCRCEPEPEDSWNNITSNFDSGDRDEALLRP